MTCICVQLLEQKDSLSLQVQQLTLDCNMHQQKSTVIHNQMRELQAERDQARPKHANLSTFKLFGQRGTFPGHAMLKTRSLSSSHSSDINNQPVIVIDTVSTCDLLFSRN